MRAAGRFEGSNNESKLEASNLWRRELEMKWNKLQECLSTRDDFQTIEFTIDSLVIQLEGEESACVPGNRKAGLLMLKELVDLLNPQFEYTGQIRFIDLVIRCQYRAIALTSDGDPDQGGWMSNLGASHLARFRRLGDPEDLSASIGYHIKSLLFTPQEHPGTPIILCSLGNSHHIRFQCTDDRSDIDKAIDFYTQAMNLTPQGHPLRSAQLESLGQSYSSRYNLFGELSDIEKAIELQNQNLELAPPGDPRTPGWLNNLGNSYSRRFAHLVPCTPDDINKAIELLSRAVSLTPESHTDMPARLTTLGNAHRSRFTSGSGFDDINRAIEYQKNALLSTPDSHPLKYIRLGALGNSYRSKFERLGELEDIENAIRFLSQSLALQSTGSEDIGILTSLGNSFGLRFERLGQLGDVDEAINYLTRAEIVATDQHASMPDILTSLSITYVRRFERLQRLEDINKAVDNQTRALRLLPAGHVNRGLLLNNLGELHAQQFHFSRKEQDMRKALEAHVGVPGILHNLANLHSIRLDSTPEEIDIAIEYQKSAVSLTPKEHPQLPNFTSSLGALYLRRYREQGKLEDIDQAIHWLIRAVELTPEEHARMPFWLMNLGESHLDRYRKQKDIRSLYSAIECYRKCAQHSTVFPTTQMRSAFMWAKLSSIPGLPLPDNHEPLKAYQTAMDLVPHVVWLGTNISKQHQDAKNIKDLASSAAALAITAQKYDLALEWLEQGRSVVWSQMLQLRNPLDDLAAIDPLLAADIRQVAAELSGVSARLEKNTVTTVLPDIKFRDEPTQKHHRLAEKYQKLVTEARKLPGLDGFLKPAKVSKLVSAAQAGPLAIINIDESRCDALVIRPGTEEVTHIPLTELSLSTISSIRIELDVSLRRNHVRERGIKLKSKPGESTEDMFEHVLTTLWTCIAKPVLDALGYKPKTEDLPHITWCTTGALSFLPLHASGYYDRPQAKLSDYAISSYTPTLSTLLSAISCSHEAASGLLAVGQESTPGKSPLPGTKTELANIKKHVREPLVYSQLDGHRATSQAVLSAMEPHAWVHFACHAYQNVQDPTKSGFLLHEDTLYLEQIARVSFQNKGLAFLSACQTATGDDELPDEAIHLASGMLM
ncbi:hypothetical protein RSAG8_09613, partial [Rhizoctonia solani AG-8 WAC10335]